LIPTVRAIRKHEDIVVSLDHLTHITKAAAWLSGLDLPVRLIAIPEGAFQGFNDEVLNLGPRRVCARMRNRHPRQGDEALGTLAR
jgi:hypothetical protein